MVVARGCKQQRFRFRAQQLAHSGQHEMPDDFSSRRPARLARDDGAQLFGIETLRERLDMRGFAGSLTTFKGDESSAPGSSFGRWLAHRQSFSAPARNIPMTSSLAPSIARRIVDPWPTDSAAKTGASMATLVPRHTLTTPTG